MFGKLRFLLAMIVGKIAEWGLRVFTGRGTNTPGIIMQKICPDALARFKMPKVVICVTGTNGKTSTSNLVTHVLRADGRKVVNNSKGSNMAPGLISALLTASDLRGRVNADIAVLEVDERSSQYIYKHFTPTILLCTNLFRDSIKRNGHSEFIFDKINDYLPEKTTVLLNGNDAISGLLGNGKNNQVFYSVDRTSASTQTCENTVCDITACPTCGHRLQYEYFHYHHIGVPKCPSCGFEMPKSTYTAGDVNFEKNTFVFHDRDGKTICLPFAAGNLFNVFNVTAAAAVCRMVGVPLEVVGSSVSDLSSKTGRFQAMKAGTRQVVSMLFKNQNPISGSQSLNYLRNIKGPKDVVLVVTDSKDKVHGHEDISWLYDTDFDTLCSDEVGHVLIGGTRCYDVALRLVLAGVDQKKLLLYPSYDELAKNVCDQTQSYSTVVIYFELYAVPVVEQLKKALLGRTDG